MTQEREWGEEGARTLDRVVTHQTAQVPRERRAPPPAPLIPLAVSQTQIGSRSTIPHARVEHVTQPVTEKVESHHNEKDRDSRERGDMRRIP